MPSNSSIGYASYQQQYTGNSDFAPNDLVSIILFFSIIFLLLLSFVFYFWYTEWHKVSPQQRHEDELERQKEVDQLVENLKDQVKAAFKIPIGGLLVVVWKGYFFSTSSSTYSSFQHYSTTPFNTTGITTNTTATTTTTTTTSTKKQAPLHHPSLSSHVQHHPQPVLISREHYKVWAHRFHHSFSLLFLLGIVTSLILLVATVSNPNITSSTSTTLQAGLFVFVLCINLFLITRQRFYYRERKQLFGENDAHMNAIYKTQFDDWDTSIWSNWVQIAILIIEFFQLLTFPLRDLITVNSFDTTTTVSSSNHFARFTSLVLNAGGLMPDMRTPVWYTYTVWSAFVVTIISLLVALLVHSVNLYHPYKIPNRWVRWCISVATLLYIPVLTTFVSSAACQSLNVPTNDYAETLRCHAPNISQQLYLWLSLFGYIIAYFLMTMFLTSYERIPVLNEIAFKSISVAFIKNMGLLLAIVFLLVESTTNKNRMRAILSIIILLTMICYNIKTKPCYVDKVNIYTYTYR
ncbi:hypothetical protein BC941DRAFT_437877 [Chlamydoabsidia padenii]|nr:hypothetical protein BC941DRAFT_437877 [Chlamydoabsidia padenii]